MRKRGRQPRWVWICRTCRAGGVTAWKRQVRAEAIAHYGGKCACCGETELVFLCIDHEGGGGNAHRKEIGTGAYLIYAWLKRHGWPAGFRVLCWNCNSAIQIAGECPHQQNGSV